MRLSEISLKKNRFQPYLIKLMKKKFLLLILGVKALIPAFIVSCVIIVFAILFADLTYQPKPMLKRGFEVAIDESSAGIKKEEKIVNFAELIKIADITRGEKVFKKCTSCHNVNKGEGAKVGPGLFGVVGRQRASFAGFSYSDAMKAKGGSWDRESLNQFITKPKDYVPGTKMAFAGIKKPQDRADVILFLESKK